MRIYFSGVGGVAIGPLAEIAFDAEYDVLGSDLSDSLVTRELRARGITVALGQDGLFLREQHDLSPIDWFVYTAALPDDHPELVLARQLGIRISKRDELLAHIITEKQLKLIAISGTHGKTTTTGMLVWAFKQLGIPASYSVGTTLSFGPSGKFDPDSKYFIYECDEFDRNFLHFSPYVSLISSIGYDHAVTYPTEQSYLDAFGQFIAQSQHCIAWQHDVGPIGIDDSKKVWLLHDDEIADVRLAGEHNRRNATLALKALEYLGFPQDTDALNSFPGTDRRFERLADNLYTDYGHHPEEIAATLQLARELSDKVILIYQPHQNERQHEVREQYTDSVFSDADEIYWLPTYLSREDPLLDVLTPRELTSQLSPSKVQFADMDDSLWNVIRDAQEEGSLVLCMGAGSIDDWLRKRLTS